MIPIKKEWLAGGLVLASAGVWIPQFLGDDEVATPREIPGAEDTHAPEPGLANPNLQDIELPGATSQEDATELDTPRPESIESPGESRDLASILQSLAGANDDPNRLLEDPLADASAKESANLDALREFAEANPFQGVILGPDGALALIGHRVVRKGDILGDGDIQVGVISDGWVELSLGETELRMTLPPFIAHERSSLDSGSDEPQEELASDRESESDLSAQGGQP